MHKNIIIIILSLFCLGMIWNNLRYDITDVNRDGKTDILDLLVIQKKILGDELDG